MNQIQRNHLIPLPRQKVLKLDGLLRADPPALTAAGAFGHIVFKGAPALPIIKIQRCCRTIFHAGQTPVAVFVYSKVRHKILPFATIVL